MPACAGVLDKLCKTAVPRRDRSTSGSRSVWLARPTWRRGAHDEVEGEGHMPHLRTVGEQQVRSSATDLDAGYDRFRCGTRPISSRSTTDFGAELDRSRGD